MKTDSILAALTLSAARIPTTKTDDTMKDCPCKMNIRPRKLLPFSGCHSRGDSHGLLAYRNHPPFRVSQTAGIEAGDRPTDAANTANPRQCNKIANVTAGNFDTPKIHPWPCPGPITHDAKTQPQIQYRYERRKRCSHRITTANAEP